MVELTFNEKRKGRQVMLIAVLMIIGFFCLNMTIWMIAVTLTAGDKSHGLDRQYAEAANVGIDFQKLVKESALLGWKVESEIDFPKNKEKPADWSLQLKDGSLQPIIGAEVEIEAFHNSAVAAVQKKKLKEGSDGRYHTTLRIKKDGKWRIWIKASKDSKVFYFDHTQYIRLPKDRK